MVPKRHADSGAGFAVGGVVRQVVGNGEAFIAGRRADAARDVHPAFRDILPDLFQIRHQLLVTADGRQIGDGTVEIHRAHRLAGDFVLLSDRLMVLSVLAEELALFGPPAYFEEESRLVEIFLFVRQMIQLDQSKFNFLVAGSLNAFARAEDRDDVIGEFLRNIEQLVLPRGLIISDARLDQMPGAIQLVTVREAFPTLFRLDYGEVCIEVAIRLLRGGYLINDGIDALFQLWVAFHGERISDAFDDLVHIGIVEEKTLVFAFGLLGGAGKVLQSARDLALTKVCRNGGGLVGAEPWVPKRIVDVHLRKWNGRQMLGLVSCRIAGE